ncbi:MULTISPECIES: Hsp20/alpha crystallin family protein [Bacillus]|uniref:Spore gernimation protein GerT n=2 Tax=Bacillus TaxID=1386 RepID=A0A0M4G850_9BACI|nr:MULTISPECIES: Hsp20/alpha crystallin family protein [Bacillus]ALC81315.1 spore gernimation protein GerT [Bacillus gobiensis]MBP1080326.1 HSP20 family molecular chaperone IbpA [Bacillus capparidis]MED1094188.1 Hsp20/alpha crystallin family protein [Bacillus capparidis]
MFDWNRFFPFQNQFTKDQFKQMNPNEVESYVNQVMSSVFGKGYPSQFPFRDPLHNEDNNHAAHTFETNDHVFVKLQINEKQLEEIKIKHTSHTLIIENFPKDGDDHKIILPSLVKRKGTKASYNDGNLEIRFMKLEDYQLSEIEIS